MTDLFDDKAILAYAGRVVATRRQARRPRMTQEGLARAIGLKTAGPISRFERGEQWLPQRRLLHVQEILDIPADQLYPKHRSSRQQAILTLLLSADARMEEALWIMLERYFHLPYHLPCENVADLSL